MFEGEVAVRVSGGRADEGDVDGKCLRKEVESQNMRNLRSKRRCVQTSHITSDVSIWFYPFLAYCALDTPKQRVCPAHITNDLFGNKTH